MKSIFILVIFLNFGNLSYSQVVDSPCSYEATIQRHLKLNQDAESELNQTELELQKIIKELKKSSGKSSITTFVIPVVMHVFHYGEDGKMDMDQALSGLEILNNDFNGLNDGWKTIDEEFDSIKGALDITFCLARIDPEGNPTSGLIYYEDEDALYNQGDLFQYAWDNYKYLNIYFPKYSQGMPSNFTAYAYFPSTFNTNANLDGVFYSSIRWGYGNHSELEEGDDWASVCSHEAGHWLNLYHTFTGGCIGSGDFVDDTPPTQGSGIELEGCYNNDLSCNVTTNGENFMDYNHRCKKMFSLGQIERMTAALNLPSRINLWSPENLIETGCIDKNTANEEISLKNDFLVYPNPASNHVNFRIGDYPAKLNIFNIQGQLIKSYFLESNENQIDANGFNGGVYFFSIITEGNIKKGKFIINK